jgi:hypothetical protein
MFRAFANRCADLIDELLVCELDVVEASSEAANVDIDYYRNHPHRLDLRVDRARRAGQVAAPPAHCVSPVRPASMAERAGLRG